MLFKAYVYLTMIVTRVAYSGNKKTKGELEKKQMKAALS